jgi:23S rRNA pseudouridine2605 synthase
LFEAFQLPVSRLMRVRFVPIMLPPRLKRGMMMALQPKEVVSLLEWAGLEAPKGPLKQRSKREIEKAATAFTPKARKAAPADREGSAREGGAGKDVRPAAVAGGRAGKPVAAKKPAASRRVRQTSDLTAPRQQKRSDRNRGRG